MKHPSGFQWDLEQWGRQQTDNVNLLLHKDSDVTSHINVSACSEVGPVHNGQSSYWQRQHTGLPCFVESTQSDVRIRAALRTMLVYLKLWRGCKSKQWLEREERASISLSLSLLPALTLWTLTETKTHGEDWGLWFWKECQSAAEFPHWLLALPVNWWIFPQWRGRYLRRLSRVRMIKSGTNDAPAPITPLLLAALLHQITVAIRKSLLKILIPLRVCAGSLLLLMPTGGLITHYTLLIMSKVGPNLVSWLVLYFLLSKYTALPWREWDMNLKR